MQRATAGDVQDPLMKSHMEVGSLTRGQRHSTAVHRMLIALNPIPTMNELRSCGNCAQRGSPIRCKLDKSVLPPYSTQVVNDVRRAEDILYYMHSTVPERTETMAGHTVPRQALLRVPYGAEVGRVTRTLLS